MSEIITLKCKECGNTVDRVKNCPYTGIEPGRGWIYICDCRGEMEVLPSDVPAEGQVIKMFCFEYPEDWTFPG